MSTKKEQKPVYLVLSVFEKEMPDGLVAFLEARHEEGFELVSVMGSSPSKYIFKAVK